jgi:hypothetical protein
LSAGILQRRVKRRKRKTRSEKGENKKEEKREKRDILVYDCSEELETWENLSLWDRSLDDGGYFCDPDILGCYIVRSRYSRNVDVCK